MQSSNQSIMTYESLEELIEAAARRFSAASTDAISRFGRFNAVLAGGSTPRPLYEKLAAEPFRSQIDWSEVHLFLGDERCVPPTHQESNYLMVKTALTEHIPIPEENIHRIPGELGAEAAADHYQKELQNLFKGCSTPAFDFVLLGMGDDGHTASLFPGAAAIHDEKRWVVGYYVNKLDAWRITLTPPVLNAARQIVFLIAGGGKAVRLHEILRGPFQPDHLPAQAIQPTSGQIVWMLDKHAAANL